MESGCAVVLNILLSCVQILRRCVLLLREIWWRPGWYVYGNGMIGARTGNLPLHMSLDFRF